MRLDPRQGFKPARAMSPSGKRRRQPDCVFPIVAEECRSGFQPSTVAKACPKPIIVDRSRRELRPRGACPACAAPAASASPIPSGRRSGWPPNMTEDRLGVRPRQASGHRVRQCRGRLRRKHCFSCAPDRANLPIHLVPRHPQTGRDVHVAHFDFGTVAAQIPQVDLPDLVSSFKAILAVRGRRPEQADDIRLRFRPPDEWKDDFAISVVDRHDLLYAREPQPSVGGGHRRRRAACR